jgi:hypothetical protein
MRILLAQLVVAFMVQQSLVMDGAWADDRTEETGVQSYICAYPLIMMGLELEEQVKHGFRSRLNRLERGVGAVGVVEAGHALELPEVDGENPCHHWVSLLMWTMLSSVVSPQETRLS